MGHVDLGPQHPGAVAEAPGPHVAQQAQVLIDGAVPPGACRSGRAEVATGGRDGLGVLVVDVGQRPAHQVLGPNIELLEVVRGVDHPAVGLEAEPGDVVAMAST